jgi:hypothetical protein
VSPAALSAADGLLTALVERLEDANNHMASSAERTLKRLGPVVVAPLRAVLAHGSPRAREHGLRCLVECKGDAAPALPELRGLLSGNSSKERRQVLEVLEGLGQAAREALPELLLALQDTEGGVRRIALGLVREVIGTEPCPEERGRALGEPVIAVVTRLVGDPDAIVRMDAKALLDSLGRRAAPARAATDAGALPRRARPPAGRLPAAPARADTAESVPALVVALCGSKPAARQAARARLLELNQRMGNTVREALLSAAQERCRSLLARGLRGGVGVDTALAATFALPKGRREVLGLLWGWPDEVLPIIAEVLEQTWPPLPLKTCERCGGKGKVLQKCKWCVGRGSIDVLLYRHPRREVADQWGRQQCAPCGGQGTVEEACDTCSEHGTVEVTS